ncbi:glyoxalase-like domain protein [Nodosilinea sp. LEGE 07088]|uniref:glyoxalase-like domain protein n=1 Tax=Nodosilinea sp. LEGE 07088 TaxID=2777968 RepID=UPI00187F24CC|nr:glyoxalase-like domain protein [Nodosilinea sp. LEGE 07088]MBE9140854.1 glyoxalase-like domain protein [Nodosilinea sp. LEGE 07088]
MLFDLLLPSPIPAALLGLPLDSIMSTQGIMVMLLVAYAGAMWMFLKSAPKVYTVMVSDLEVARSFYEGMLNLPAAEVPLHYYYNYEQTLGTAGLDPMYLGGATGLTSQSSLNSPEGLWYQLRKNTQLHVVGGASLGARNQQRHVCFDHSCLEYILMRVQLGGVQHKIRREKPLNFLVRDYENQVIELAEIDG